MTGCLRIYLSDIYPKRDLLFVSRSVLVVFQTVSEFFLDLVVIAFVAVA